VKSNFTKIKLRTTRGKVQTYEPWDRRIAFLK